MGFGMSALNLGDVYFQIKNDLAKTKESLADTDKEVEEYRTKWSKPLVIPITFSQNGGPGGPGGGGFGGGNTVNNNSFAQSFSASLTQSLTQTLTQTLTQSITTSIQAAVDNSINNVVNNRNTVNNYNGGRGSGGGGGLARRFSGYLAIRALTGGIAFGSEALAEGMEFARDQATFSNDPTTLFNEEIQHRKTLEGYARIFPFGIGEAAVGLRDAYDSFKGVGKGDLEREATLNAALTSSYEGIAGSRRSVREDTIRASTFNDPIEQKMMIDKESHGKKMQDLLEPFNNNLKALQQQSDFEKATMEGDVSTYWGIFQDYVPGSREKNIAAREVRFQADKTNMEHQRDQISAAETEQFNKTQIHDEFLLTLRNLGIRGQAGVLATQMGLDPESQMRASEQALTLEQSQKMGITPERDKYALGVQQTEELNLLFKKNDLQRANLKIDVEQIKRGEDINKMEAERHPLEAKRLELLSAQVKIQEEIQAKKNLGVTITPEDLATEKAATGSYNEFKNVVEPRALREQMMPLQLTGQVQGFQIQGAQAFLNRDYQGANYANKEAEYYARFGAGAIDIEKTVEPDQIAQKKSNLEQQVTMEELSLQTSISRGYAGTSKNVFQDIEMGYRNVGKEENRQKEIALLEQILKWIQGLKGGGEAIVWPVFK